MDKTIADENSTTNQNNEQDNSQEQEEIKKKNESNFAKILSDRNQYRKESEEYKKKAETLEQQLNGLSEKINSYDKKFQETNEYLAKLTLEQETKTKQQDFLSKNPDAKEFINDIEVVMKEYNVPYEKAYKLVLVDKSPDKLIDPAKINQKKNSVSDIQYMGDTQKKSDIEILKEKNKKMRDLMNSTSTLTKF